MRERPGRAVDRWTGRNDDPVTVRFRKHRRPCGQPAVVGEIGRFRPVPPQAGHLIRINATPSDLPFKSTGFATYPEPPQFGQSSGATPSPPRVEVIFPDIGPSATKDWFSLRNPNKLPTSDIRLPFGRAADRLSADALAALSLRQPEGCRLQPPHHQPPRISAAHPGRHGPSFGPDATGIAPSQT